MTNTGPTDVIARLNHRFDQERNAREQAESLLTEKNRDLLDALTLVRESERRLQTALWASGEGIWEWSAETRRLDVIGMQIDNEIFEWPENDFHKLLALIHADDRDATSLAWNLHVSGTRADIDAAFRLRIARGIRWIRIRGRALERDDDGRALRLAGTIKDITNQRQSEQSLHRMAHAFASTQDGLAVIDSTGWIVEINHSFEQMTGTGDGMLLGMPLSDYMTLPPDALESAGWRGESELRGVENTTPVEVTVTTVDGIVGQDSCQIVSIHDISERVQAASRLERMALQDSLTGLPNRTAVEQRIDGLIADGIPFALLFADLDGFKTVNDSYGHGEGDKILREVALRFSATLGEAVVARWGGDEFVCVIPDCADDTSVLTAAGRISQALLQPIFTQPDRPLLITPSIGAALYPRDGSNTIELFRKADAAMYQAKSKGRNRLQMFEPEIEHRLKRRMDIETQLGIDARDCGFTFFAQPKVDREGRQSGAELLVRWTNHSLGAVSPAEMIPIAEQTGAIEQLGSQALKVAAALGDTLCEIGRPLPIAVNLSPRQLQNPRLIQDALQACKDFGISASLIELELTESALADGVEVVRPLLQSLRNHGFGLALDDFGTGYSSLSHLRQLPFQKVKIDRSFLIDVIENKRAKIMIESILSLCHGLGLTTVAEGVETQAQFDMLRELGVDEFQGYLFARPMPIEQWVESLKLPSA